jgi:hypothetical protein
MRKTIGRTFIRSLRDMLKHMSCYRLSKKRRFRKLRLHRLKKLPKALLNITLNLAK